jgi:hypothetical protein
MALLTTCPMCGLESSEIRCPRCNALKLVGCSGACSTCGSSCKATGPVLAPDTPRPSDEATSDQEHPGTPLER